MDEHRDEIRIEPVGSRGVSRTVPILTFVIGIFLGAAIVEAVGSPSTPPQAAVASAPTAPPRPRQPDVDP